MAWCLVGAKSLFEPMMEYFQFDPWWNIVNSTPRNTFQWNINRKSYIFIQENVFENIDWKMAAISSWPQCVNRFIFRFQALWMVLWLHSGDQNRSCHYTAVIMGAVASQITRLTIVYSTVYSDADQRKHQSSVSLAFVWGIHRWPVNSPHKWPVTRKMFPFDDVIMVSIGNSLKGNSTKLSISA